MVDCSAEKSFDHGHTVRDRCTRLKNRDHKFSVQFIFELDQRGAHRY